MSKTIKLTVESLSVLDELTDEQAGALFKAIRHTCFGKEVELDQSVKIAFSTIKCQLLSQIEKSVNRKELNKLNGSKGGMAKALKANRSKLLENATNCLDEEKPETTDAQHVVHCPNETIVKNVSETDSTFSTDVCSKSKRQKKAKSPFNESEIWFLDLFNSLKAQFRDNPRPHKSISDTGRRNLQKLLDTGHLQPDFEHAITAMLGADWPKRTGNDTPDHVLREENFLKYLNVQSLKQVKYGADKPNSEEQWATAFDTLKQFYAPEQ